MLYLIRNQRFVSQCGTLSTDLPYLDTLLTDWPYLDTFRTDLPYLDTLRTASPYLDTLRTASPYLDTLRIVLPYLDTLKIELPYLDTLGIDLPYLDTLGIDLPYLDTLGIDLPYLDTLRTFSSRISRVFHFVNLFYFHSKSIKALLKDVDLGTLERKLDKCKVNLHILSLHLQFSKHFYGCQFSWHILFICYLPRNWNFAQIIWLNTSIIHRKIRIT